MILLSLIVATVSVAIPRFDFFNNYLLSYELDKLFVTFCYLQQKSIAGNKKCFVVFDQVKNSYSCYSQTPNFTYEICSAKLCDKIGFGFIDGVMGPPGNPTKKIEKFISLENVINNTDRNTYDSFSFWPDGRITHGSIYLVDKANKSMGALTCSVSQVSYIRRYKYENLKWKSLKK
jgi:hypothetical protein